MAVAKNKAEQQPAAPRPSEKADDSKASKTGTVFMLSK